MKKEGMKRSVKKVERYKLKTPTLKDQMFIKILKETPVVYVKLELDMSSLLQQFLIQYAEDNMKKEIKDSLLIDWAFADLLKKFTENENAKIIGRGKPSKSK